ncbi:MAG: glycoside hydrolase family 2 TIM barrel-domain containing protein, partial [Ferruginibacter sp.]
RHSFWPTSGRTTSKALSIEDVRLMKDMNMNAVRMSHYPPDAHFLDACDSLGLFVLDELAGWHGHYDTETGTKLVKEMLDHDRNHPSIILWSNGNEGGHNLELDHLFDEQDIQHRNVIHPWQLFNGIETQHYREYNYGIGNYEHGHDIIMPTEFLHGLYDGGHGAGLQDYWDAMLKNPLAAGGFLWDFADEGVVRKDRNDSVDTDGNHGADGIMGPFHEKEGSYYAIKEIWSPVYFEPKEITAQFDQTFNIENRFSFTNLNQCSFHWELKKFNLTGTETSISINNDAVAQDVKPFQKGQLKISLPNNWKTYDVLYVTAKDVNQKEIFTWSFPIARPVDIAVKAIEKKSDSKIKMVIVDDTIYNVIAGQVKLSINKNTGSIISINNDKGEIPFTNGPVLQEAENNFKDFSYHYQESNLVIESAFDRKKSYNSLQWTIYPSGWIKMKVRYFPSAYFTSLLGVNFSFPEKEIKAVDYMGNGPYRVWKNRMKGNKFGVWNKIYNNTVTGESWNYPEFKGYYSNLYWCRFMTGEQSFTVLTENEDVFLRLFTPAYKTDQWHNYEPTFPTGDISFMQAIPAIGTKTQRAETTGPMGMKNIFYDYEKDPSRAKELVLYFNFSSKQE